MSKPAWITDNGAPIPIRTIEGPPLGFDELPRYGVWTFDGRRYQCTATGNDLAALQREYGVPQERIVKTNAAVKLGIEPADPDA